MKMTFEQYIQNPMGVANSVISNREMYRSLYTKKLDAVLVREIGYLNKMECHLYKDDKRYIAYLKIPSEVIPEFYYDVVVEFTEPKTAQKNITDRTLNNYLVRFYSNDPSFVFTFAHAFLKNDMFIKELSDKMSKKAIKERADEKNPHNIVGYVKSLYFAYIIMNRKGLFNKAKYNETFNLKVLKSKIMDADTKIRLRQELASEISKENKRNKSQTKRNREEHLEKEIPTKQNVIRKVGMIGSSKTTPKVKPIKSSKVAMNVKKAKTIK